MTLSMAKNSWYQKMRHPSPESAPVSSAGDHRHPGDAEAQAARRRGSSGRAAGITTCVTIIRREAPSISAACTQLRIDLLDAGQRVDEDRETWPRRR